MDVGFFSTKISLSPGASGLGVSRFAVAGFTTGDVNTGVIILGFGGATTGAGGGIHFAITGCLITAGLILGGGCGFHGTVGGAAIGVIQCCWIISSFCGMSSGMPTNRTIPTHSSMNPAPRNLRRDCPSGRGENSTRVLVAISCLRYFPE